MSGAASALASEVDELERKRGRGLVPMVLALAPSV